MFRAVRAGFELSWRTASRFPRLIHQMGTLCVGRCFGDANALMVTKLKIGREPIFSDVQHKPSKNTKRLRIQVGGKRAFVAQRAVHLSSTQANLPHPIPLCNCELAYELLHMTITPDPEFLPRGHRLSVGMILMVRFAMNEEHWKYHAFGLWLRATVVSQRQFELRASSTERKATCFKNVSRCNNTERPAKHISCGTVCAPSAWIAQVM